MAKETTSPASSQSPDKSAYTSFLSRLTWHELMAIPLVAVGVKADSGAYELVKKTKSFALNMLGKGQQGVAFGFFKPAEKEGSPRPCRASTECCNIAVQPA